MMLYPSSDKCVGDCTGELVWHWFCLSPMAETVQGGEDVAHSFKFLKWPYDIQMNVMKFR